MADDGSTDESAAIAERFGCRVVRGRFGGASATRLAGLAEATGDALMFLDADDLLGPNCIAELGAVLENHPVSIACCAWMRYERVAASWLALPPSCAPRRPGQDDLAAWLTGWYHPPCSILWSRSAYARSGGWDVGVAVNNDGDLMMRALVAGTPLVLTDQATAYYRRLPDGAQSLSGRRFSRVGLMSRLDVLDRIARNLADNGNISRYRADIAEAYAGIAQDARADATDLAGRAGDAVQYHGGMNRSRRMRRHMFSAGARYLGIGRKRSLSIGVRARDRAVPSPDIRDERPLVSVVVPTYNRAELLRRALAGVLAQSYGNFELLVIDDGSTEDIEGVVQGLNDARLKYLRQPGNRGVAAARNRGLTEAAGSLIAFLDSDDEWTPDKLSGQIETLQRADPRVGLVYSGLIEIGSDGVRTTWVPTERGDVWKAMLERNIVHFGASGVMIRRDVVDLIGGFDESLPAIEDYDYWTRAARFFRFDFTAAPLICYHSEAPTPGVSDDRRSRNFAANMAARQIYVQRYGADAVRAGALHAFHLDSARRHLEMPDGDSRSGITLLVKAIRRRPTAPRLYVWLAFAVLPRAIRRRIAPGLKSIRTRLPERLWFGRGRA